MAQAMRKHTRTTRRRTTTQPAVEMQKRFELLLLLLLLMLLVQVYSKAGRIERNLPMMLTQPKMRVRTESWCSHSQEAVQLAAYWGLECDLDSALSLLLLLLLLGFRGWILAPALLGRVLIRLRQQHQSMVEVDLFHQSQAQHRRLLLLLLLLSPLLLPPLMLRLPHLSLVVTIET